MLLLLGALCVSTGCRRSETTPRDQSNLDSRIQIQNLGTPPEHSGPLFHRLTSELTGVDLVHNFPAEAGADMLSDQNSGPVSALVTWMAMGCPTFL